VAFAVWQHDSLIFEQYWNGWAADSVSNSFSVAKSYVNVCSPASPWAKGRINSVFQPVGDFLPEYKEGCYAKINLCTMCSP
jgi:hypothetical protein